MEIIQGYEIIERIEEKAGSIVYRGRKPGNKETVIVKILKTHIPSLSEIARFKHEYEIIKNLSVDGIIKTYEVIEQDNKFIIIQEDFKGSLIDTFLKINNAFNINQFLSFSIKIARAVGELHKNGIIHKNLKPDSILINPEKENIAITDFGILSVLTHENEQLYDPYIIQNSLLFISPEQTGRINRVVDYRTDLYSIGMTFYKMLTGSVPFESNDPLEIIHSHIAKDPEQPHILDPGISKIVSDIIMKLISKNAEDRYQNAFGLMADLNECLEKLQPDGKIDSFELTKHDISNKFIIPQRLFGRERETNILISAYDELTNNEYSDTGETNIEIMFVSGGPGIGKSALINEINKPITKNNGYFLSGKYEQFRGDSPYNAIIHAFQKLIKQLLSESNEKITQIKNNILEALGVNGKIITDLIPELELLIGAQPDVPDLGPNEARNRFNNVFEKFVAVFAQKEHPIVLFLDDLQWADFASFQLIKLLMTSITVKYMYFIASYRDNEIEESHPLYEMISEVEKRNPDIKKIHLSELGESDVKELIINFLKCSEEKGESLARFIFKRTNGNPFFVNEFLHTLYNEKLLENNAGSGWVWDLEKIEQMRMTDNVVEFLANKIIKLPDQLREVLKICACIGNRFDLETLSVVLDNPIEKTLKLLNEIIDEGYISISGNIFVFNHDRIQEAAYSLVPVKEIPKLHYRIGNIILQKTDPSELNEKILYITDQLNLGQTQIIDSEEKEKLVKLNYKCGLKTKASSAFQPSFNYFLNGINLLEGNFWDDKYELTLALYTQAVETAYLIGDYVKMDNFAAVVLEKASDIYDKVPVYETKIHAFDAQLDFDASIDIALDVLNKLNFPVPKYPGKYRLKLALIKIRCYLFLKGIENLTDLPEITDPRILTISKIFALLTKSSLYILPDLYVYSSIEHVLSSLKYGQCDSQSLAYVRLAVVLINVVNDIEGGYKLGRQGIKLIERFNARNYEAGALGHFYLQVAHWKEHLVSVRSKFMEVYSAGIETGDLENTGLSIFANDGMGINIGSNLVELEQKMSRDYHKIIQLNQQQILGAFLLFWQVILNLLGRCESPLDISGSVFDMNEILPKWKEMNARTNIGSFYVAEMKLKYNLNDYKGALTSADNSIEYHGSMIGALSMFDYYFYKSLSMFALYNSANKKEKKKYRKFIKQSIKKIKRWRKYAPVNNEHRLEILIAENARILGKNSSAEIGYDNAIDLSNKNGFIIEEAISNELAGNYYLDNNPKLARVYIQDAYLCYAKWGALSKLKLMRDMYPEILIQVELSTKSDNPDLQIAGTESGTSNIIDLRTVIKASQVISGEMDLGKLLAQMIKIAMENAGAQKGYMILEDKGKYYIEAEGLIDDEEIKVLNTVSIEDCQELAASIIHYTARTKEILILNNASAEGDFVNDPYILKNNPKSILCIPIINHGKLIGFLYLENNLSTDVFTQERREILNILSSQMAISIENAMFYKKLGDKIEERTKDLSNEIKERKKIEEQLKDSNKELENFAYIVSHDLQEPLRKITVFGDRLKDKHILNSTEKTIDYIDRMQKATKRMQALIQGLLKYSRAIRKSKEFENIELNVVLHEVLSDLEVRLQETGGKVEAEELPVINADAIQMRQVFQNLIGNALKFRREEESPIIKIYTKNMKPGFITIFVEDNGIGINEKDYDKIFGVFQRLHGKSEYEGHGIGLATCKKIVENHNGKISVQGEPGKGTKFIIDLPV